MTGNYVVAKFGGTSVQNAQCMNQCAAIIAKDPQIKVVVVSATAQTTNQLEQIAEVAREGKSNEVNQQVERLKHRHFSIGEELNATETTFKALDNVITEAKNLAQGILLLGECSPRIMDHLYSIGERLSSILFKKSLENACSKQVHLMDARDIITTNDNFGQAHPNLEAVSQNAYSKILPIIENADSIVLTQGFIGKTAEGITTTLGREGSDYTATLLAEAIDAHHIQIWKDVSGIASTDPRTVKNVRFIPELSYMAMAELSALGAKVLHPFTLRPAIRRKIPLYVGNTFSPDEPGTWIKEKAEHRPVIQAICTRENQQLVTFHSHQLVEGHQFFAEVFKIIAKYRLPVDLVNTHEYKMTFLMNKDINFRSEITDELEHWCRITREDNLAMVSLIGNNPGHSPGVFSHLFNLLEKYSFRQVHFGVGRHDINLLCQNQAAQEIREILHRHFIEENHDYCKLGGNQQLSHITQSTRG